VVNWLASVPSDATADERRLKLPGGVEIDRLSPDHDETGGHDAHASHDGHGGHDHGDMMAIVGEPSADGLVMEPIELQFQTLGTPFPAGLAAEGTLDGDVVAECRVEALLAADDEQVPEPPDRLAPKAWEIARTVARERAEGVSAPPGERWTRIAALELERAVSHTAWLRSFARVLAWPELIERSGRALAILDRARTLGPRLADAGAELEALSAFVRGSRRLRWRTAGRGCIPAGHARHLGLRGPAARASGVPDDARTDDPLYRQLGFEPVVHSQGDALARTVVRAAEAAAGIDLAARAVRAAADSPLADAVPTASAGVVEGPRGPLQVAPGGSDASAPGEAAAREAAGPAAVGEEWAAALVALASFDLSPWQVGS
jgi:hypothetical protein